MSSQLQPIAPPPIESGPGISYNPRTARAKRIGARAALYSTAMFFVIFAAMPFAWMILTIFKQNADLYQQPMQKSPFSFWGELNQPPTLENLRFLLWDTNYLVFVKNSLVVGFFTVVITLLLAMPAAYALTRLSGGWGESLGIAIFLVYLIPPTLLFLPMTRIISELNLKNSIWSLVVVYPTFTIPFCTWLLMGFFKSIPWDVEEQAMIDGYSRFGAIIRAVLPLSVPGILTVIVFSFTLSLHEFVYSLAFVTSTANKTISTGVTTELIRGDIYFWQALMAASVLVAIPIAILYNLFLDRFIAGFTLGAVKG
ncbi:MAG: carbohydrate ABC transporter permease [Thermomicrobiales bacterium]|nr:carbohydrate ABC transporter permease [Thermomicrobiales bacterium]